MKKAILIVAILVFVGCSPLLEEPEQEVVRIQKADNNCNYIIGSNNMTPNIRLQAPCGLFNVGDKVKFVKVEKNI